MPVLVQFVVLMLSVVFPIIALRAHALMDTWVMHLFIVYRSRIQPQNLVIQILVDLRMSAMCMEIMLLYVILALDPVRTTIHNVVQNVYLTQIVHSIKHVYVINVKILVLVFVEVNDSVFFSIIIISNS